MRERPLPITAPTGLKARDAALHCGISEGHFRRLVREGLLPAPRDLCGVKVWLRQELDAALFSREPVGGEQETTRCDAAFGL